MSRQQDVDMRCALVEARYKKEMQALADKEEYWAADAKKTEMERILAKLKAPASERLSAEQHVLVERALVEARYKKELVELADKGEYEAAAAKKAKIKELLAELQQDVDMRCAL